MQADHKESALCICRVLPSSLGQGHVQRHIDDTTKDDGLCIVGISAWHFFLRHIQGQGKEVVYSDGCPGLTRGGGGLCLIRRAAR